MIRTHWLCLRWQFWLLTFSCAAALQARGDVRSLLPATFNGTWSAAMCRSGMDPAEGDFLLQVNARRRVSGWFTNTSTQEVLPVRGQITRRGQMTAHVQQKLTLRGVVSGVTNAAVQGIILRRCVGTFESSVTTNCCVTPTNAPPLFPDTNLAAYVSQRLGKPIEQIGPSDLADLGYIDLFYSDVRDLTGLQFATNLWYVYIWPGSITNYSALYQLPNLRRLYLSQITNGTFLSNFTQLEYLSLSESELNDPAPLLALTNLYGLNLYETRFPNVAALAQLPGLSTFSHEYAGVSNATPYAALTQLHYLGLYENPLGNLAPLAPLTNLWEIRLGGYPLTNFAAGLSPMVHLVTATVSHADMPDLNWLNAPDMVTLLVNDNLITNISPLGGLKSLSTLDLSGNPVSDLSPLVQATNLTSLYIQRLGLNDLSFAASLPKLSTLNADDNLIVDLAPLTNCPTLTGLSLNGNKITNLSALAECTNLFSAYFRGNEVDSLPDLSRSKFLSYFDVSQNHITDLSPLTNLTSMRGIYMNQNQIVNIDALASMPYLNTVSLEQNSITNISALSGLTNLYTVWLYGNPLDLSGGSAASNVVQTLRSRGVYVGVNLPPLP